MINPCLAKFCQSTCVCAMSTMSISLPDVLKFFVDEQVNQRGCGTSSEYVRELIRKGQGCQQLRSLLLAGAASAPTTPTDACHFEGLCDRVRKTANSRAKACRASRSSPVSRPAGMSRKRSLFLCEAAETTALGFIDGLETGLLPHQSPSGHGFPTLRPRAQSARPAGLAASALPTPRILRRADGPHRRVARATHPARHHRLDAGA